jgi:hypothetical protein
MAMPQHPKNDGGHDGVRRRHRMMPLTAQVRSTHRGTVAHGNDGKAAAAGPRGVAVKGEEGYAAAGRRGAVATGEEGYAAVGRRGAVAANDDSYARVGPRGAVVAGEEGVAAVGRAAWSLAIATRATTPGKWPREWGGDCHRNDAREAAAAATTVAVSGSSCIMPTAYHTRVMSGDASCTKLCRLPPDRHSDAPAGCTSVKVSGVAHSQCGPMLRAD